MIITWIIEGITGALSWIFSILPSWSMPSWLSSGSAFPSGVATTIGGYLHVVAPFLPVDLVLTILATVLTLWVVVAGYLIFQWVWSHVPTISGFGTGDGG